MKKAGFLTGISLFWLVLSILSDGMNTLLLPERLLRLGGTQGPATQLGLLTFVGIVAGMLIQPIAGAWSDRLRPRWGRKGVLAIGTVMVIGALAVFGFSTRLVGLAIGFLLVQISLSIIQSAQQGFIPDQVPAADRGLASGVKSFMDIGGAMLGFVLLGQVLGSGQPGLAVLIMAVMTLVAMALTALLVREPRNRVVTNERSVKPWQAAFSIDLQRSPQFIWLVISRFFFLLGTYAVGRFLLLFVASRLGLEPEQASEAAGNLLAGLALVTVIFAPLGGWAADRIGRKPFMLFGALVSAAGAGGYIFAASMSQIFWFGCLLSLGSAAFTSANWAMTADIVPKDEAARYFGIANFGTAGAAAAAGLLGPLVDANNRISPGGGFSVLFLAAAAAFVICAISLWGIKDSELVHLPASIPVTSNQGLEESNDK